MQLIPLADQLFLEEKLLLEFGPYVPVGKAWRLLSYPSLDAARKSFKRGVAPLDAIRLDGRRGQFVSSAALAEWLADALLVGAKQKKHHVQNDESTPIT
ncbi:MAG: hypothetical protein ACREPB_07810 [Arenimonas sp.]